jgi:glycosyltransferase involved in cell wall biosynthesis
VKPSIVILTYNSELSLAETLRSAVSLSDDIHVIDSFSTDRSVEIACSYGAIVAKHVFENYGAQRNWAISSLAFKYKWQLHLDADERITPELHQEIVDLEDPSDVNGFYIPRLMRFLGRPIRHGGMCPTWHMRLFRSGYGKCEARKYDQHFYVTAGQTQQLKGFMIDDVRMPIGEWTSRHNRWSDAEVEEQLCAGSNGRIEGKAFGNPVEKKRFLRGLYNDCPLFLRPFVFFFYRYIIRFGFLDGTEGFIFYVLQTFWFRFLIDTKLFEQKLAGKSSASIKPEADCFPFEDLHAHSSSND